jgi:hypothetical protein
VLPLADVTRTTNLASGPSRPSQFSKTLTQEGPKWNGTSNRNTPKLEFAVTHRKQNSSQFLIATFRAFSRRSASRPARRWLALSAAEGSRGRDDLKSAPRKLENSLTHAYSATSKFLIDNFCRHFALCGVPFSSLKPLTSSAQYQYSNRQSYEKLEVDLTHLSSTKVLILIDTKTHFVQGKNAQFQCRWEN